MSVENIGMGVGNMHFPNESAPNLKVTFLIFPLIVKAILLQRHPVR